MATIIAGGFETYVDTQAALQRLREAGIAPEYVCEFRVNPPGMHDQTAVGGDRDESPGAQNVDSGAAKGAAIGAAMGTAAGVAITPLIGPAGIVAGAGVGAYTGSLVGGLKGGVDGTAQPDHTIVRPAEALVAVNVDGAGLSADEVASMLERCGAWQVERAEGLWENGQWADFDPVSVPNLIGGRDPQAGAGRDPAAHTTRASPPPGH
jgi:hypothetical protein